MLKGFKILGGSKILRGSEIFGRLPILTLSHVWHKMAYDFLNAFVETRNLRYWETKSAH